MFFSTKVVHEFGVPTHHKSCCNNPNKFATCFSLMCLLFGCSQQALDKYVKKKLFTVDNFSEGLFSLFGVKTKTCLAVGLMKPKLE
jgi:hypothetical protein